MQLALGFILFIILIGFLYEQVARYKANSYKIEGEFVDVGGHKLHYLKKGDGKATIIFESGADFGGHIVWRNIQEKLSSNFTTLSYDRAGTLHSQRGNNPKTCATIAQELHIMIEKLDLPKPYILVGHSLAGLTLRAFIDKYPKNIVGVVMLDPGHPEVLDNFSSKTRKKYTSFPPRWLASILLNIGFIRVIFIKLIDKFTSNAKKSEKENFKEALALIDKGFDTYIEEFLNWQKLSDEVKGIEFKDIPIVVLGATKPFFDTPEDRDGVKVMNEHHLKTVKASVDGQYIALDCAHTIQFEKPDIVVQTVEEFAKKLMIS